MASFDQPKYEKVGRSFRFLKDRCEDQATFKLDDVMIATEWSRSTAQTYITKQYDDFIDHVQRGVYRVKPEFARVNEGEFLDLISQKRNYYAKYRQSAYGRVASYEFLLPLTKEDKLKDALDSLFYLDTLKRRLTEIGLEEVSKWAAMYDGEAADAFFSRVAEMVAHRFGGYSITHVNGRFQSETTLTRQQAAQLLVEDRKYLVDETTASVRFIFPLECTRKEQTDEVGVFTFDDILEETIAQELEQVRGFVFHLFAEAIVRTVKGEELIWLVEDTGTERRLYVWERDEASSS